MEIWNYDYSLYIMGLIILILIYVIVRMTISLIGGHDESDSFLF
jgi:hypothetical protein